MTWSRFDDGYDEHDKVETAWDAQRATVGLHVMATTACNRWLSDGVIKPRWLIAKLPDAKERAVVLAAMVTHGLFDRLDADEQRTLEDSDGNAIAVGPFGEERYIVHDFLDRHDSSVQTKARRRADAERKRRGRRKDTTATPTGVRADANGTPTGGASDSTESPSPRERASGRPHPDPTRPSPEEEGAAGPRVLHPNLTAVVERLQGIDNISIDEMAIDSALRRAERAGVSALDLADQVASTAHQHGTALRVRAASTLMHAALDRRERSSAADLAAASAEARAAAEGRARGGRRGRPSAEERARALEAEALAELHAQQAGGGGS